jgi:hypothetical protein
MRVQIAQSISEEAQLIAEILLASQLDSPKADQGNPELGCLVGPQTSGACRDSCRHAGGWFGQGAQNLLR